jgi:hypothetical protein
VGLSSRRCFHVVYGEFPCCLVGGRLDSVGAVVCWEADSRSYSKEIIVITRTWRFVIGAYSVPVESRWHVHILVSYLRLILGVVSHLRLGLVSFRFHLKFPVKILHMFIISATHITYPTHPIVLITLIIGIYDKELWIVSLCNFYWFRVTYLLCICFATCSEIPKLCTISVFWEPCRVVKSYRRFRGICCVHGQGRRILFYSEDRCSRFPRNVGKFIHYIISHLRR